MSGSFLGLGHARRGPDARVAWTWLSGELLLMSSAPAEGAEWKPRKEEWPVRGLRFELPDEAVDVLLVRPDSSDTVRVDPLVVELPGGRKISITRQELAEEALELEEWIGGSRLAEGDRRSRRVLHQMLLDGALPGLERPGGFSLARRLYRLRDVLRETLGDRLIERSVPLTVHIDALMAIDDRSFWVAGWMRDQDQTATSLTLVSPEGQRADLLEGAYRHARPDVEELYSGTGLPWGEQHGFVKFVELPLPSPLDDGWLVELLADGDRGVELPTPPVVRDPTEVENRVLSEFELDRVENERLRIEHAHPAMLRFQRAAAQAVEVAEVRDYGDSPVNPDVSVVVPLYGRIDFLEHQLAQFARDPEMSRAELVYVLDSPELAPELSKTAPQLFALHGVPFRVVRMSRNAGYAMANNVAVERSHGRLVLLLNSDVLPTRPGWLGRLAAFHASTPGIGALGPKLLFEDDSIQHAGMYLEREIESAVWGNRHYFKGFHRDFPEASISRPVPAVTAACLMIARDLYQRLGGLDTGYVRGGYEDSDLCIRLIQQGLTNWYLADVELYHLEAQSFPSPVRRLATVYNSWLQTHRWDEQIERMSGEYETFAGASLITAAGS